MTHRSRTHDCSPNPHRGQAPEAGCDPLSAALCVKRDARIGALIGPDATEEQVAKDRKALVFNCCQRAHANSSSPRRRNDRLTRAALETLAYMVPCTAVLGLRYPNIAAVAYGTSEKQQKFSAASPIAWRAAEFLFLSVSD